MTLVACSEGDKTGKTLLYSLDEFGLKTGTARPYSSKYGSLL
jgi:hypothetical protein